jgi:hypothetical protein
MMELNRTWVGMFDQPNFGAYPVMLSVADRIRVDYPSLTCGGFLSVEKIDGDVAYLPEKITYGRGNCLDGVQVQLSKQDGLLRFVVVLPDGSRGGEGVLSPVPPPTRHKGQPPP